MVRKSKAEKPTTGSRKRQWRIEIWMESKDQPHPVHWDWVTMMGNDPQKIIIKEVAPEQWSDNTDG